MKLSILVIETSNASSEIKDYQKYDKRLSLLHIHLEKVFFIDLVAYSSSDDSQLNNSISVSALPCICIIFVLVVPMTIRQMIPSP